MASCHFFVIIWQLQTCCRIMDAYGKLGILGGYCNFLSLFGYCMSITNLLPIYGELHVAKLVGELLFMF